MCELGPVLRLPPHLFKAASESNRSPLSEPIENARKFGRKKKQIDVEISQLRRSTLHTKKPINPACIVFFFFIFYARSMVLTVELVYSSSSTSCAQQSPSSTPRRGPCLALPSPLHCAEEEERQVGLLSRGARSRCRLNHQHTFPEREASALERREEKRTRAILIQIVSHII